MKNNKITAIIIFFIVTIALMFWISTEKNNNKSLSYYKTDLEGFKSIYSDLTNSLDTFIKSPNIENYAEVQYLMGRTIGRLGSLDRTMSECYKMGLLQEDKLKYKDSDVTVIVARIVKDSKKLINESIELIDNKIIMDEVVINSVYEELMSVNDLMKPYYDTVD